MTSGTRAFEPVSNVSAPKKKSETYCQALRTHLIISLLVSFAFSLKLLLLLFPAETITGNSRFVSLISFFVDVSLAAIGFEMNFDLMLLLERRSPL